VTFYPQYNINLPHASRSRICVLSRDLSYKLLASEGEISAVKKCVTKRYWTHGLGSSNKLEGLPLTGEGKISVTEKCVAERDWTQYLGSGNNLECLPLSVEL
jgi:hypothetical protein